MRFTRRVFFAGFGLTVLFAVGAYGWQFSGLAGPDGIWPLGANYGPDDAPLLLRFFSAPVLLALSFACGVALLVGFAPRVACLVLWACWSALVRVGYPFLSFQWDVLLAETAFFAALYAPGGWRPKLETERDAPWAFRFVMIVLAVKVTLESGVVKLASGDPTWRDLTALTYHWWSQPLPTWTSVYLAQLPLAVQRVLCGVTLALELVTPLLAFGPRRARLVAAVGMLALQAALFAAGNYAFYNLLTFVLAVPLLDDAALRRVWKWVPVLPESPPARAWTWSVPAVYALLSAAVFLRWEWVAPLRRFDTLNAYGAFAVMTKNRAEILIEGSDDGVDWKAYEFPWKPGDVTRQPQFVAPWQPRLDWQMWFASLGTCDRNPWLLMTQQKLLQGSPQVLALFAKNPFPDKPPRFMRTRSFEYRFAPLAEKGVWWSRTEVGEYCPSVMLDADGKLARARY